MIKRIYDVLLIKQQYRKVIVFKPYFAVPA